MFINSKVQLTLVEILGLEIDLLLGVIHHLSCSYILKMNEHRTP